MSEANSAAIPLGAGGRKIEEIVNQHRLWGIWHEPRRQSTRDLDELYAYPVLRSCGDRIGDVTPQRILLWLEAHRELSPRTKNIAILGAKRVLAWATRWKVIPSSPLAEIEGLHQPPPGERRSFEPAVARRVIGAADRFWPKLFRLYLVTGARRCELSRAVWGEVDLDGRFIKLPPERAKTNTARRLYLGDRTCAMLDSWRSRPGGNAGADAPVFPSRRPRSKGFPFLAKGSPRLALIRACLAAGVDPTEVSPHTLRRTTATWLMGLTDLATLCTMMGWTKPQGQTGLPASAVQMALLYAQRRSEPIERAVQALEEIVFEGP